MLMIGYWQVSNRQMFFNKTYQIEFAKEYSQPHHGFFDWEDGVSYTGMVLLVMPVFIFFRKYTHLLFKLGECFRFFKDIEGMDRDWNFTLSIDENLGSYWECLPGMQQKRWFTQEARLKGTLNMGNVSESSLEHLRTCKRGPKILSNVHNYDIL